MNPSQGDSKILSKLAGNAFSTATDGGVALSSGTQEGHHRTSREVVPPHTWAQPPEGDSHVADLVSGMGTAMECYS